MGDGAAYTAIAMKEAIQDANLNDELISNPLFKSLKRTAIWSLVDNRPLHVESKF